MTDLSPPVPGTPRRVALITGASRGIGAATAKALARQGFACVLAVRDPSSAAAVHERIAAQGVPCRVVACDVTEPDALARAVDGALREFGRLDALVNNAGQIEPQGRVRDLDPRAWARAIEVNLMGAFHAIHAALPALLESRGSIVNVSTGAAVRPREGWSAYCASKAGLHMLSQVVHKESGADGLHVYSFQPGVVDTSMQAAIRAGGANEVSRIPRDQLHPPEVPASVIAWLAARLPADLCGQELSIRDEALLERVRVWEALHV